MSVANSVTVASPAWPIRCSITPGTRRRMGGNDLLSLSETTVPEATAIAGRRQRPLREQRREARERARAFPLVERHQLMLEAAARDGSGGRSGRRWRSWPAAAARVRVAFLP